MSRLEGKGIYEAGSAADIGFHPNRQAEFITKAPKQRLWCAVSIQTGIPLFSKGWGPWGMPELSGGVA